MFPDINQPGDAEGWNLTGKGAGFMDKSTYLKQLETALRGKYAEPQVKDILADYEDFFASGAAEGKSEAELCAEFGPPGQAAIELKGEDKTEPPRRKVNRTVLSRVLLAGLILAVLWPFFGPELHVSSGWSALPEGPVDFRLALLLPLALEGILALWASQSASPKKPLNWLARVNRILAVPVTAVLILLVWFAFSVPWESKRFESEGPFGPVHFLTTGAYYGSLASELLLFASVVLLMLYSLRGHPKVHWFLFLDTALLTVFLNFTSLLSHVNTNTYNGPTVVASCFLWAVLPNLAAAGIDLVIRKIFSVRRARAWTGR